MKNDELDIKTDKLYLKIDKLDIKGHYSNDSQK